MERLFRALQLVMAPLRGSLYIAVILTATIFAMATGIVGAAVTVLGIMAAPIMMKSGYSPRLSAGAMMGRMMREYFLPLLGQFGFFEYLKHDQAVPDSDVTPEYCAKHNWIVGSPATAAEKIAKIYDEVGGFGVLLVFGFDYTENPQAWRRSLELLSNEVLPKVKGLVPGGAPRMAAE